MNSPYYPPLSSNLKPLLPNEPRVLHWDAANALTERYLLPAVDCIETLFLGLRKCLDQQLIAAQPIKNGKPYPLGQCLEISLAMKKLLSQIDASTLTGDAAKGFAALAAFLRHGGTMRQVWGDLRGEYFQNAFLAGTLYIDVSNDTVTRTKPPVEILPFVEARFSPVRDYVHFAQLASRYWKARLFPNHVLPSIAPYFPLIAVIPNTGVIFQSDSAYMLGVVEAGEFRPSEASLSDDPLQKNLFQLIADCLDGSSLDVVVDPVEGRGLALRYCEQYRDRRWHLSGEQRDVAFRSFAEANKRLAHLQVQASDNSAT